MYLVLVLTVGLICMTTVTSSSNVASLVASYSAICQNLLTKGEIIKWSQAEVCASEDQPYLFEMYFRFGFCTEDEYINMTTTLCGQTDQKTTEISEARKNFYLALDKTSSNCQYATYKCIVGSIISSVFKVQEQFCSLMNLNVGGATLESCMTSSQQESCTHCEFNQLKSAACGVTSTKVDQRFSRAILGAAATCQYQISICTGYITGLVNMEMYCEIMNLKNSTDSTEACLQRCGGCAAVEVEKLKAAACNPIPANSKTSISSISVSMTFIIILFFYM